MDDRNRIPRCEDDQALAAWCMANGVSLQDFGYWLYQNDLDNPPPSPYPDNSGMRIKEKPKTYPHANRIIETELSSKEIWQAFFISIGITIGLAVFAVGACKIAEWLWRAL